MARKSSSSSKKGLIFLLVSAALIVIFANLIPKIQVYIKNPEASSLLTFPADHISHPSFRAEWWYLNLLARTTKTDGTSQKDLGYVLSFSRILGDKGLLNSRYDRTTKSFSEKTDKGGTLNVYLIDQKYLFVQYSNGQNYATLQVQAPVNLYRCFLSGPGACSCNVA